LRTLLKVVVSEAAWAGARAIVLNASAPASAAAIERRIVIRMMSLPFGTYAY
jgi:hypothetical protein